MTHSQERNSLTDIVPQKAKKLTDYMKRLKHCFKYTQRAKGNQKNDVGKNENSNKHYENLKKESNTNMNFKTMITKISVYLRGLTTDFIRQKKKGKLGPVWHHQ